MSPTVTRISLARQHLAAVLVFAAVILVVFHRAIFFGELLAPVDLLSKELPWRAVLPAPARIANFAMVDVFSVFYPWKYFVHEELQAGRFPLWCTHLGCGYPLAGEGVIKLFGLTTLFLGFWTPRVASILTYSSQLFIAMTGMYALLRSLRLGWTAAVFGASLFGLNSAVFQHLPFEHMLGGMMLLPWICWAVWQSGQRPEATGRFVALAGLFFGLTLVNGSVQSAAIVWLSAASFAVTAAWRGQRPRFVRRAVAVMAGFSLLGVAIGAVALAPNLELLAHNVRPRFVQIDWLALFWKRPVLLIPWTAALLNPDAIGNYQTFDLLRGLGQLGTAATTPVMSDVRVYCGLIAVVLAILGWRVKGDARALAIALILVPLIAVVITPLYLILYFRGLIALSAGMAILAALGVERWQHPDVPLAADRRRLAAGLVAAIVGALLVGAVVTANRGRLTEKVERIGLSGTSVYKADINWQKQKARETVTNFSLSGSAVLRFSVLAAATALLLARRGRSAAVLTCLLALNTVDLIGFAWRTNPSVPRAYDFPATPALEFLRQQPGRFRVVSVSDTTVDPPTARPNTLLPYGLDDPRVYESLYPANPLLAAQDWNALNVRFIIVPPGAPPPAGEWRRAYRGEVDIHENLQVQPRISFATELPFVKNEPAPLEILEYVSGRIHVAVTAPRAGWLIIRERAYPGWRASVNGKPVQTDQAQEMWQAVPVEAGHSVVRLSYQPVSVQWGACVTVAALAVTGLIVVLGGKRYG